MSDEFQQPIVVKRIRKGGGGHHGGAWKIAYADFVTAMMAFFLLMWLLGSTTKGDLQGIAEYFATPLRVALAGGSGSGDSSSVIKGGGEDLTRTHGQVKRGEVKAPKHTINLQALKAERERKEREHLQALKRRIERAIEANRGLAQYRSQLLLDITPEGLRIQIVDDQNRPMFDLSSAEVKPYMREILREIGGALNDVENKLSLTGYTDAKPFVGGDKGVGNWELSANRANASRRELIAGGMAENKVIRVVGGASTVLFDRQDPFNPMNRRISIVVLNKRTEQGILNDGREAEEEVAPEPDASAAVPVLPPSAVHPAGAGAPSRS